MSQKEESVRREEGKREGKRKGEGKREEKWKLRAKHSDVKFVQFLW